MANASFALKKFEPNMAGYVRVLNSEDVVSLVAKAAEGAAAFCNASFESNANETHKGYTAKKFKGRLATGYLVSTQTHHAKSSERRHNRLVRSIGHIRV